MRISTATFRGIYEENGWEITLADVERAAAREDDGRKVLERSAEIGRAHV